MKKVLVIGSTVVDVIVNLVDHLPRTGEDVHVKSQHMSLGGCAYNVSDSIRHFEVPYVLFSPVGTGAYGQFVRDNLASRGITTPIPTPDQDNGCCYCFVENTGERTFICYHGAEYLFRKEWFDLLDLSEFDAVYICGLEIEETTGPVIVDFLEAHPWLRIFFAPGPRLNVISPELLERLYRLSPVLHLNETEALTVSGCTDVSSAAHWLYNLTHNTVIVTLGEQGCFYYDGSKENLLPSIPVSPVDTIGAGDSHIGAVIACLQKGDDLETAIAKANQVSAAVVATSGALLPDKKFRELSVGNPKFTA
ncbi:MAG: PfkB family carbohydrate kinase [Eubacteriales bacterium]|nr:PfkB family carbohydrate kinase [Eubacteriales bacterium]